MRKNLFEHTEGWVSKAGEGDINILSRDLLLLILKQIPPKEKFGKLRLVSRAFRELVDDPSFVWEPRELSSETARTLVFNLGQPNGGGDFYLGAQWGGFRWPAGLLLVCRDSDNSIEIKALAIEKSGCVSCTHVGELAGHQSKISVLKPLSRKLFVSGDQSGNVIVWINTSKGIENIGILKGHEAEISAVTLSDKEHLLTADKNGHIRCWKLLGENQWAILWKRKLALPIVSLKVEKNNELEVICSNTELLKYPVSIHDMNSGEKIRDEDEVEYGRMFSQYQFSHFSSFLNGYKLEMRKEVLDLGHRVGRNIYVCNSEKMDHKQVKYAQVTSVFYTTKRGENFQCDDMCVFTNGNMLFWSRNGNAKLVFQKQLPTFKKYLPIICAKDSPIMSGTQSKFPVVTTNSDDSTDNEVEALKFE